MKLDGMLAQGIEDVKALGIELYDIIPTVRVTDNKRRIGSAQDMNRAIVKFAGRPTVLAGKSPLFRISISRSECSSDADIKNVIYHEILHCAPNCQDHQATWKGHAARVNAVYGLNVTTTKKTECADAVSSIPTGDVSEFVGKCFRDGNRTFKFTGFNTRPKNNCDIVDVKTGKAYVCPSSYLARKMVTSQTLFGATVEPAPSKPVADTPDLDQIKSLVGKKVKNGPCGRKIFTVVSVNPNASKKAIVLIDENGCEYTGAIGCAARLVVVG